MIRYYKLFDLLNRKGMKKTDLLEVISAPTLSKLSKGETIKTDIIDKICEYLNTQPGNIMEHISEKNLKKELLENLYERYDIYSDLITKNEMNQIMETYIKPTKNGYTISQSEFLNALKNLYEKKLKDAKP